MFQSDLQAFYHHKTGEYTVATNLLVNFTFNVVIILLKSATDKIIVFETVKLKLKICICIIYSSYEVKNRNPK